MLHTNLTANKIVILYVTFWNWSVRQYSCQFMTEFVNLLCQYVSVSFSVLLYKLQSVVYMLMWLLLQVLKQIDVCGHIVQVKCCERPDPKMCQSPCNMFLRCGHMCATVCSAVCTQKCQELVPCTVRPACGHSVYVPCYKQNQCECYRFICAVCYMWFVPKVSVLNFYLNVFWTHLLQSMTLGKLHSSSNIFPTDHSSTESHFPLVCLANVLQFFVCFPSSRNDDLSTLIST